MKIDEFCLGRGKGKRPKEKGDEEKVMRILDKIKEMYQLCDTNGIFFELLPNPFFYRCPTIEKELDTAIKLLKEGKYNGETAYSIINNVIADETKIKEKV
jgi:hypothetical protein